MNDTAIYTFLIHGLRVDPVTTEDRWGIWPASVQHKPPRGYELWWEGYFVGGLCKLTIDRGKQ